MGVVNSISHDKFPKQGRLLGEYVDVCFNYDTKKRMTGLIVRDDIEEPNRTIIQLENGLYVLSIECQFLARFGELPHSLRG